MNMLKMITEPPDGSMILETLSTPFTVLQAIWAVMLVVAGYAAVVFYFADKTEQTKSIALLKPESKQRIGFIVASTVILAGYVVLFNTIYKEQYLWHKCELLLLAMLVICVAATDYRVHLIPNRFIVSALIIKVPVYIIEWLSEGFNHMLNTLVSGLIGAVIVCVFFLIIALIFKNSIGMGDIKLFAVICLYQGLWGGITSIFFSMFAAFLLSVGLLITKQKRRKDSIPLAPSIMVGTLACIVLTGM